MATIPQSNVLVSSLHRRGHGCARRLTVTLAAGSITIHKLLAGGGRINPADPFTVNLLNQYSRSVVGAGTSSGTGGLTVAAANVRSAAALVCAVG